MKWKNLFEIIESEREKYKKQSELRILNMYKEIQSLETQVNSLSSKKRCEQESCKLYTKRFCKP
jgi:hypothetical protein